MRVIRAAASAVLLGATAIGCVPAAADGGDHHGGFEAAVEPTTIAPGGQVRLTARGCGGQTTVDSAVFDAVTIRPGGGQATAKVFWDAKRGAKYQVTFACADGPVRTLDLMIAGGHDGGGPVAPPAHHGVNAGVGGGAGGYDATRLATGALLVAGVLGIALRRTRRRGADRQAG
ncbi:hypothetical protein [Streptomyces sp. NPDC050560]|uniref:hypothetical protein n=1 Tax=Streptomyces sp. NPDC050560 TaxID=3365630 RepID=UPI00379194F7